MEEGLRQISLGNHEIVYYNIGVDARRGVNYADLSLKGVEVGKP